MSNNRSFVRVDICVGNTTTLWMLPFNESAHKPFHEYVASAIRTEGGDDENYELVETIAEDRASYPVCFGVTARKAKKSTSDRAK